MNDNNDDFNEDSLCLSLDEVAQKRVPRKRRKKQTIPYAQFPIPWFAKSKEMPRQTLRVAILLQHLHWEAHHGPFSLSNVVAKKYGISRHSKWDALVDLEQLGLITVERRKGKSP
jgi:hypothetical protein